MKQITKEILEHQAKQFETVLKTNWGLAQNEERERIIKIINNVQIDLDMPSLQGHWNAIRYGLLKEITPRNYKTNEANK